MRPILTAAHALLFVMLASGGGAAGCGERETLGTARVIALQPQLRDTASTYW